MKPTRPAVLFEDEAALTLAPFTLTRPVWELRVGIDTFLERWTRFLGDRPLTRLVGYLAVLAPEPPPDEVCLWLNARLVPTNDLLAAARSLAEGQALVSRAGDVLAAVLHTAALPPADRCLRRDWFADHTQPVPYAGEVLAVAQPWDFFRLNGTAIRKDFAELTAGRQSEPITDPYTRVYAPDQIFVEPGATITAATLNAQAGPIYIGAGADVQENAAIHGAHALLPHAVVNMGAKLRGDTTLGPWCKVGGEVSNSVLMGYSNKAHDGFLGNSVLGHWCNLGADTNNSNLKNNYSAVAVHSYAAGRQIDTGLLFCGLFMGDHAKAGINTMFNTGTVVGVCANVFGGGFPPKFIPSFSWGGADGFEPYDLDKALETAERVQLRRGLVLSAAERAILTTVAALDAHRLTGLETHPG
jgi:UDP-N-acetylglucosamine diphosphorylase/glucosamine-1-phosphate N-acetyltransferase